MSQILTSFWVLFSSKSGNFFCSCQVPKKHSIKFTIFYIRNIECVKVIQPFSMKNLKLAFKNAVKHYFFNMK